MSCFYNHLYFLILFLVHIGVSDGFSLFSDNNKVVEILLAHEEEPILRSAENKLQCFFSNSQITSVVPGDFDGDALMDVMVTTTFKRTGNL